MKAIVFGGSGFLGSHTADALTKRGYSVKIFDIVDSPYCQSKQEMIIGDILDEKAVKEAIKDCDFVYNFAGTADIEEANNNPLETIKKNVLGNGIILEACKMNEVKRYLFSSSLYVYSNFGDFYRSSKQACELFIENYNKLFGLPYTILRYGSLYGPRSDKSNYIFRILKQAITKGEIVSFGESEDLREYIHVEDAARYSVDILSEEFKNQYIIITGNQPMRRKELLVMIKEMFNNKIDIKFTKKKSDFHYNITPYSFSPKIAKKYSGKYHLDMGQGLLQCIDEIYKDCKHIKQLNGVIIKNGVNDALETEDE